MNKSLSTLKKIVYILCGSVVVLVVVVLLLLVLFFVLWWISDWVCPQMNGSQPLGKNIHLVDWDGGEQIIVVGTDMRGRACYGGIYLIPTRNDEPKDGEDSLIREKIINVTPTNDWIEVTTFRAEENKNYYYLIDKRSIPKNNTNIDIVKEHFYCFDDSLKCVQVRDSLSMQQYK